MTRIDDPSDLRLAPYRNLKDVQQRVAGCFVAESELVVTRVIESACSIRSIVLTPARAARLAGLLSKVPAATAVYVVEPTVLDAVVGFPIHRGVLALVDRPPLPDPRALLASARRVVVLEDVVDPDNVGAIFRHAAAFGADAVLLSAHAGDPLYRKAVRTSMGRVLSVPYARVAEADDLVDVLREAGLQTLAFTPSGDVDLRSMRPDGGSRLALLVGAEAPGLRADTMANADVRVRIAIDPAVDSLNVATAAAIAMYELFR